MSLANFLRSNVFLILFFVISAIYGYGIVNDKVSLIYLFKPFITISLIIYYLKEVKNINSIFLIALVFAFLGDLLFNIITYNTALLAMGSFLIFNLLLMVIASERVGVIKARKLFLAVIPFAVLFVVILNMFFKNAGDMTVLINIYGFIVVLMCAFSLNTFLKIRDKESLYFLLGALFFITASVSKGLKEFSGSSADFYIKLVNISGYALSLFFFCQSLILSKAQGKLHVKNTKLQNELEFYK